MDDAVKRGPAKTDPRETINEVLRNLHGSLKWFWQLVMGFSMARAVDIVYTTLLEHPNERSWGPTILFVGAFVPTFVRFYFGDARYLDRRYIEHRRWRPLPKYFEMIEDKVSARHFWIDVSLLLVHGVAFVLLALSLAKGRVFFEIYAALLLCNVFYLRITRDPADRWKGRFRKRPRTDGPGWWMVNNVLHTGVMIPVLAWSYVDPIPLWQETGAFFQLSLLWLACVSNSVVDLLVTAEWYFPKLDKLMDRELRE